jgi:hypothetical protein
MGFAPAPRIEREPEHQKSSSVEMGDETGLRCLRCASALTFKEMALGLCRVCGAETELSISPGGFSKPREEQRDNGYFIMPRNSRLGEVAWPEDAPLW